jgi:tetratricopeptide (TPR) repeat protein
MIKRRRIILAILALLLLATGILVIFKADALAARFDRVSTWLRFAFDPVSAPTAAAESAAPDTQVVLPSYPVAAVTPAAQTPLPARVMLTPPTFDPKKDFQGWNNCGPATLALALRYWGWQGDQDTVASIVKPYDQDRNVNIEELADYAREYAGLSAVYRVAGDLETLKRFISAGYPVIVETSFTLTESFWPGDDRWSSHFVLLTGYDDALAAFTAQDVFLGPNTSIAYAKLQEDWQSFNYLYMVLFPSGDETVLANLFGSDWSEESNWQKAAALNLAATNADPKDAFAWFNLGASLAALGQYDQAWLAFTTARQLGLPQRMLRYQFSIFEAAYETGHARDLLALTAYALEVTPNSEETFFWQGEAYLSLQQYPQARQSFVAALSFRPGYPEAVKALNSVP